MIAGWLLVDTRGSGVLVAVDDNEDAVVVARYHPPESVEISIRPKSN